MSRMCMDMRRMKLFQGASSVTNFCSLSLEYKKTPKEGEDSIHIG